jgi:hypothetical protein
LFSFNLFIIFILTSIFIVSISFRVNYRVIRLISILLAFLITLKLDLLLLLSHFLLPHLHFLNNCMQRVSFEKSLLFGEDSPVFLRESSYDLFLLLSQFLYRDQVTYQS